MGNVVVHGYTKHVGGKLVTVHGFEQNRDGHGMGNKPRRVRQMAQAKRHHTAANSGIIKTPTSRPDSRFTRGLSPHAVFPANRGAMHRKARIKWWIHPHSAALSAVELSNASEDWVSAVQEAIDHILVVIANNPRSTMQEILQRVDVQQALQVAGIEAARTVVADIQQDWQDAGAPEDSPYLNNIVRDMIRNGASFPARMTQALSQASPQDAQMLLLRDQHRAAAAQATAQTRAQTEANLAQMKKAGIKKVMWRARLIPGTHEFEPNVCTACKKLHGKVINIGLEFDKRILSDSGIKPYRTFIGPPAHPHCRCVLIPA